MRNVARCAAVVGAVWLVACSGEKPDPGGEISDSQSSLESLDPRGQQIVFWYQHTQSREAALQQMVLEFNEHNPQGITVRGEYAGDYGDIYNKMMVGLQGGALPDLVVAYQNQAQTYYHAGGVVDLNPYMDSPRWGLSSEARADYVKAFLHQDQAAGKQIGLPPNRSIEVLYYNEDWLQELGYTHPPSTWEQFADMCRAARDRTFSGNQRRGRSVGFILDPDASRLATMVYSRGGAFMGEDQRAYTLDTPEARSALAMMQTLAQEEAAELMGEANDDQQEFATGACLFLLRSSSGLPFVKDAVDSGSKFHWAVAAPPRSTVEPVVNVYGASLSVCRTTAARQLAAWLFLKWFTEPAQQARWVVASNYFPARKSTAQLLESFFEENPRYRRAYDLLDYGKPEPSVPGYEPARRLIAQAVVKVIQGADVDRTLEQLQREANATLEND